MSTEQTAHTPGPWEAREAPYGFDIVSVPKLVNREYERGLLWVASVTCPIGAATRGQFYPERAECAANARLIAAEPDLLAAADMALNTLIGSCRSAGGCDDAKHIADAKSALRAAIAKAEGRPTSNRDGAPS